MVCRVKMEHIKNELLSFRLHTMLSDPVESCAASWGSSGHPTSEPIGISEPKHKAAVWARLEAMRRL